MQVRNKTDTHTLKKQVVIYMICTFIVFHIKLRNLAFTMLKVNIRYSIPDFKIKARFQTNGKVILRTLQQSIRNISDEDFLATNKPWFQIIEQFPVLLHRMQEIIFSNFKIENIQT